MKAKGIFILLVGLGFGLLMAGIILLTGSNSPQPEARQQQLPPSVGSPAADFSLQTLNGGTQKLSDLRGKPVMINFWATWCPPCEAEMPMFQQYAEKYADQLVILGVNYAEEKDLVADFVQDYGLTFPILLDSDGSVAYQYYVRSYPSTFFVDADGVVRSQHLGLMSEELLVAYLETVGIKQ